MKTKWTRNFITRRGYEVPDMIDNNVRDMKIEGRKRMLKSMSNDELAKSVVDYFDKNRIMNREKAVRDVAQGFNDIFKDAKMSNWGTLCEARKRMDMEYFRNNMKTTFRNDMIEEYSAICVKQAKLAAHDLDSIQSENRFVNLHDNIYELPVIVGDEGKLYADHTMTKQVGTIESGFVANHRDMRKMNASLIVADNTNGKMIEGNCTFRIIIDLGQREEEMVLALEKPVARKENEKQKKDPVPAMDILPIDEDFANAVRSIPVEKEPDIVVY